MRTLDVYKDDSFVAEAIDAGTFFLRLRGLLGRRITGGQGLLLTPCDQIHTFGMGYPIDTVYIDREGGILKVDAAVPAGKACARVRGARSVLELPAGEAEKAGLSAGNRLRLCKRG